MAEPSEGEPNGRGPPTSSNGSGGVGRHTEARLPPTGAAARTARELVRAALAAWDQDDLAEVATLLTSELVTNAVVHAHTAIRLAAELLPPELVVEVGDHCEVPPVTKPVTTRRTGGRGLLLVAALAERWGTRPDPEGKTVWFALSAR